MPDFRDVYKNRAEAWAEFVAGQELPVSKAKFYEDCKRLQMVQPDKSVRLIDLLAYVKNELKIEPLTGQSLAEQEDQKRRAELELERLELEVAAKRRAERKDDEKWMEVVDHEKQMGAFAGHLEEALRQHVALRIAGLVHACGGSSSRASELADALEALHAEAFTEAVRSHTQVVEFDGEEGGAGDWGPGVGEEQDPASRDDATNATEE